MPRLMGDAKAHKASSRTACARHHEPRGTRGRRSAPLIGQHGLMQITCADCGCLVDRGIVLVRCGKPDCCCRDLPDAPRS